MGAGQTISVAPVVIGESVACISSKHGIQTCSSSLTVTFTVFLLFLLSFLQFPSLVSTGSRILPLGE